LPSSDLDLLPRPTQDLKTIYDYWTLKPGERKPLFMIKYYYVALYNLAKGAATPTRGAFKTEFSEGDETQY
jgi:hypothetical protein